MECTTHKSKIEETFRSVNNYVEEGEINFEETVNSFLDKILFIKKDLSKRTNQIDFLIEKLEQLTWLNDVNSECLDLIKKLLNSVEEFEKLLFESFKNLSPFLKEKIATKEIYSFRNAIDDLKEVREDLYSTFFVLNNDKDFIKLTEELNRI